MNFTSLANYNVNLFHNIEIGCILIRIFAFLSKHVKLLFLTYCCDLLLVHITSQLRLLLIGRLSLMLNITFRPSHFIICCVI